VRRGRRRETEQLSSPPFLPFPIERYADQNKLERREGRIRDPKGNQGTERWMEVSPSPIDFCHSRGKKAMMTLMMMNCSHFQWKFDNFWLNAFPAEFVLPFVTSSATRAARQMLLVRRYLLGKQCHHTPKEKGRVIFPEANRISTLFGCLFSGTFSPPRQISNCSKFRASIEAIWIHSSVSFPCENPFFWHSFPSLARLLVCPQDKHLLSNEGKRRKIWQGKREDG